MKKNGLDWRLLKRMAPYVRRNTPLVGAALMLMVVMDLLHVLHPYLIKVGIDRHILNNDLSGLLRLGITLAIVVTAGFIIEVLFNYMIEYLGQRLLFDIRLDVFKKVLDLDSSYFDTTPVGAVMTNITNDVEAIREFISYGIVTIVGDLLKIGFILTAMLAINFKLALITFLTLPIFIITTAFFRTSIRRGYRGVRKSNARINTSLVETITGIREIILFDNKAPSIKRFTGYNRDYLTSFLKVIQSFSIFFAVFEMVSFLGMIMILLFSHFTLGVSVQPGEIFAFFSYINMFYQPLRQMAEKFNTFQSAMAASERIFSLIDKEILIRDPAKPLQPEVETVESVAFKNVWFSYTDPDNPNEAQPVLKDLSFTIRTEEKVAIVGHTGSGKSTVINLINRLYDIQQGSIEINGLDIRKYSLMDLRARITTVPQDFFLFSGSVAENITLNRPGFSSKDIEDAARAVKADTFIQRLPQKYNQEILEQGKSLSTGQKQLLSFARAFVTDPAILIMDEATSNIDSKTEKLIQEALDRLIAGRTAIIIAHRLSTIKHMDRILVLHNGRLVEEGSHRELLKKRGIYAQLYRMQAIA